MGRLSRPSGPERAARGCCRMYKEYLFRVTGDVTDGEGVLAAIKGIPRVDEASGGEEAELVQPVIGLA